MSASTTPTARPLAASEAARLTVTDDLPTPPLPDATAKTRVSDDGLANGTSRSTAPDCARRFFCRSCRCWSDITSRATETLVTPSTLPTAAVTSRVIVSRIGHPATVRYTPTVTRPSAAMSTDFTMPRSVIGRRISGSLTVASAALTCSSVGVLGMATTLRRRRSRQGRHRAAHLAERDVRHTPGTYHRSHDRSAPQRPAADGLAPVPAGARGADPPPRGRPAGRAPAAAGVLRRPRPAGGGTRAAAADDRAGPAGADLPQRPDPARRPARARGAGAPRGVRRRRPRAVRGADRAGVRPAPHGLVHP